MGSFCMISGHFSPVAMHSAGALHRVCALSEAHGPGLRYAVFLQGCPCRCACCTRPQWRASGGRRVEAAALARQVARYRPYFGQTGGLTLTGGEPLAQVEFCLELAKEARQQGIRLCLETTGSRWDVQTRALYAQADLVLLQLGPDKPTESLHRALDWFLKAGTPLWIRQTDPNGGGESTFTLPAGLNLLRREWIEALHDAPGPTGGMG